MADVLVENLTDGEKVISFGSYPQGKVTDEQLIAQLNASIGELPDEQDAKDWTDYGFYIHNKRCSYAWYKDAEHCGGRYRGVYFTQYRPPCLNSYPYTARSQEALGYVVGKVHWFVWQPIKWQVLLTENGAALLLSYAALDNMQFHHELIASEFSVQEDEFVCYDQSDIRAWLNETFFNAAFDAEDKERVLLTEVDNSPSSTGNSDNDHACKNTFDRVFLLCYNQLIDTKLGMIHSLGKCPKRDKSSTDYAHCVGLEKDSIYTGTNWWTRSPSIEFHNCVQRVGYTGYYDYYGCQPYFCEGIVPAIKIKL